MRVHTLRRFAVAAVAMGALALSAVSCSDAPTQPRGSIADLAAIGQTFQDTPPAMVLEEMALEPLLKPSDAGGVQILATAWVGKAWLVKVAWVTAGTDAEITWGTDEIGYSKLAFGEETLESDQVIYVIQQLKGRRNLYLYPTGLQFDEDDPAVLSLSYEGTDLKKDDESSLDVFYLNPSSRGWQALHGTVDAEAKCVDVDLEHFSRYGIGSDE